MKRLLLVTTMLYLSVVTFGQKTKISGTVFSKSSQTLLVGATVATKDNVVKTDEKGQFTIEATPGEELTVSFVGMKPATLRASSGSPLSVELEEGNSQLEQVVVVGYNTQRKVDLTGAVSVV